MAPQEGSETSPVPDGAKRAARAAARHAEATGHVVAAFFDVDNTIIRGASAFHLARRLYSRGFFRTWDLLTFGYQQFRYLAFGEDNTQIAYVRARALEIIKGHSVAEINAIAEDVYDEVLALRIYPGTRKVLDNHLKAGHEVWLVTASPLEIGQLISRRLGATGALGTVAEQRDGYYTGRLVGDLLHGQAKATAIQVLAAERGVDLAASFAYGDSSNDIPILSEVGYPCAINPDSRLRRHAMRVGWPVREFRGRRRSVRRGADAASLAGAAWIIGLGLRTIRRTIARRLHR